MSPVVVTAGVAARVAEAISVVLTPSSGATALELVGDSGIQLTHDGNDGLVPPALYDETFAQSIDTQGGHLIRSTPQNKQGTGQVQVRGPTEGEFASNRVTWEQTIEAVRRNGGTLAVTFAGGSTTTLDVESAAITGLVFDGDDIHMLRQVQQFTITCLPFGRLEPQDIVTDATGSLPVWSFFVGAVDGSAPADAQLVLTDLASSDRRFVEVGLERGASDAPVLLRATGMSALSASSSTTSGSFSSHTLSAFVYRTPVALASTGEQSHSGRWRVRARVQTTLDTPAVYVRLSWQNSGGVLRSLPWASLTSLGWRDLDLGVIEPEGSWVGQIEAYDASEDGIGDLIIDLLEFFPLAAYAKVRSPIVPLTAPEFEAADQFTQTAGNATGKTLDLGGTWAGAGDADDFTIDTSIHAATRDEVSDTGPRILTVSGLDLGGVAVRASVLALYGIGGARLGVVARYQDLSNYIALWIGGATASTGTRVTVEKRLAGASTNLWQVEGSIPASWLRLELDIFDSGTIAVFLNGTGWTLFTDADCAAGGALDSGSAGLYDYNTLSTGTARYYDAFTAAATSSATPVIESGRSLLIDQEHAESQNSDGTVAPVVYDGSYLRLEPGISHRFVLKARDLDSDLEADQGITRNLRADLSITPRVALLG